LHNGSKPPEHKTRLVKKHKPKPVQDLIEHCVHILVILGEDGKGKGKNELYRKIQTLNGKYLNYDVNEVKRQPRFTYKYDTLDAIYHLEKEGLIERCDDINHLQKEKFVLSALGAELSNVLKSIHKYNKSFDELIETRNEKFFVYDKGSRHFRLKNKGWSDDEIANYDLWLYECMWLLSHLSTIFIDSLISRHSLVMLKFDTHDLAKEILDKAVIDTFTYYVLGSTQRPSPSDKDAKIRIMVTEIYQRTSNFFFNCQLPEQMNRFIRDNYAELLKSVYSVLSPQKDLFPNRLEFSEHLRNSNIIFKKQHTEQAKFEQRLAFIKELESLT
jgi:hypothetical protein